MMTTMTIGQIKNIKTKIKVIKTNQSHANTAGKSTKLQRANVGRTLPIKAMARLTGNPLLF